MNIISEEYNSTHFLKNDTNNQFFEKTKHKQKQNKTPQQAKELKTGGLAHVS